MHHYSTNQSAYKYMLSSDTKSFTQPEYLATCFITTTFNVTLFKKSVVC